MPRKRKDLIALIERATAERPPVLDLSKSNLEGLLDRVFQMDWLVELNLSHCHLSHLPDALGNLSGLTCLVLAENQLTELPDAIGNLSGLTRLVLAGNQLTTLPWTIDGLDALQHLDLNRAGPEFGFSVSYMEMEWLRTVPEVIWIDGKPPRFEPPAFPFPVPDNPNVWLQRLASALTLYGEALAVEDRFSFGGGGKRQEADALIRRVFEQEPGLKLELPEFYQDFLDRQFHSTSRPSEKILGKNPLRLPTKADDEWLAGNPSPSPLRLGGEVVNDDRRVTIRRPSGEETEVALLEPSGGVLMNAPYAQDEYYQADSAVRLYQAGPKRFYLRLETYGYSSNTDWLGSDDGGVSWQKQPQMTNSWLGKSCEKWREVDYLAPTHRQQGKAESNA